jgi:Fe-S-cluster-containing dehydrogenase component
MAKKLLIDLEKCYKCKRCEAKCSYYYHPGNKGFVRCLALATQEHVCRQCEESPCVKACPQKALEKRADGMLNRYSLRCTSCKTCTVACPFGVITPEVVDYTTSSCDLCVGRCDDEHPPKCALTCPHGAVQWVDVQEDAAKDIHAIRKGKYFVRTTKWKK